IVMNNEIVKSVLSLGTNKLGEKAEGTVKTILQIASNNATLLPKKTELKVVPEEKKISHSKNKTIRGKTPTTPLRENGKNHSPISKINTNNKQNKSVTREKEKFKKLELIDKTKSFSKEPKRDQSKETEKRLNRMFQNSKIEKILNKNKEERDNSKT